MDSLLTRLFTKTNELRETRYGMNVLAPTIVNLCMDCSENNISARDPTPKTIHFDETNLPKSLLLLENLQLVLNGTLLFARFFPASRTAHPRAAVRSRPRRRGREEQAAGLARRPRGSLRGELVPAEPAERGGPALHDDMPERRRG